jgi:DNA-binding MarR family transcriptional regulator
METAELQTSPALDFCLPQMPCAGLTAYKQLVVTYLKLQRKLEEILDPHGLVISQFEALAKIGFKPGMIQQELVKHLLVTKGNVGALLDRLESMGLVERRSDPNDRRANRLYLTHAAKTKMQSILVVHRAFVSKIFEVLTESDRQMLETILKSIEPD